MQKETALKRIHPFAQTPFCEKMQNGRAFVIAVLFGVLLSVGFAISTFPKFRQVCEIELQSRINPNDAPIASLVRLPGIGISRAGAIAAYRENFSSCQPNRQAFRNSDDLQEVKGIGPKTVQNIRQCLTFE
ncbi:MAG: ComEA family DNA-binding protein [Planctomycetota bacterium]